MVVVAPSAQVHAEAKQRLDGLAKPLGSLGRLEELGAWLAACQGVCPPTELNRVSAILLAGDHGVVGSGVASYPAEVTPAMVYALVGGVAGMSVLAAQQQVPLTVYDIAVNSDLPELSPKLRAQVQRYKIGRGSADISQADALSDIEVAQALCVGDQLAQVEKDAGTQLVIVGDLGIGNTTPSAALIASRLGLNAGAVTGRGAGLNDEQLAGKIAVIDAALARARAAGVDQDAGAKRRLAALGSADIAVAVALMAGCAKRGIPVLLDGVISLAEALLAQELAPGAAAWFCAGHRSPEPGASVALQALGLEPLLELGMRLGEGSGAMTALPLLRSGIAVIRNMALLTDLMG